MRLISSSRPEKECTLAPGSKSEVQTSIAVPITGSSFPSLASFVKSTPFSSSAARGRYQVEYKLSATIWNTLGNVPFPGSRSCPPKMLPIGEPPPPPLPPPGGPPGPPFLPPGAKLRGEVTNDRETCCAGRSERRGAMPRRFARGRTVPRVARERSVVRESMGGVWVQERRAKMRRRESGSVSESEGIEWKPRRSRSVVRTHAPVGPVGAHSKRGGTSPREGRLCRGTAPTSATTTNNPLLRILTNLIRATLPLHSRLVEVPALPHDAELRATATATAGGAPRPYVVSTLPPPRSQLGKAASVNLLRRDVVPRDHCLGGHRARALRCGGWREGTVPFTEWSRQVWGNTLHPG